MDKLYNFCVEYVQNCAVFAYNFTNTIFREYIKDQIGEQ